MLDFAQVPSDDQALAVSVDRPAGQGPWPVVIMVHGLTGNRIGRGYHFVQFARRLVEQGIACVRFDQRGCGESTGRFVDLTIPGMIADTRAVRDWALAQPWCEPERVGYVGVSMGALPVVAVEAERPAGALALWGPVYDMPRVFWQTARTGLRGIVEGQGWVPYRGLPIGKAMVDRLDAVDTSRALASSASPVLVFHSRADDVVSVEEGESYVATCQQLGRPVTFHCPRTADHDFSDYYDRHHVQAHSTAFFQEHLTVAVDSHGEQSEPR